MLVIITNFAKVKKDCQFLGNNAYQKYRKKYSVTFISIAPGVGHVADRDCKRRGQGLPDP